MTENNNKSPFFPLNPAADYLVSIYKNLFWIPVNSLGNEQFSCEQEADIFNVPLTEKIFIVKNLYMAVQLFIIKKYRTCDDNEYIERNGRLWEIHKSAVEVDNARGCGCAGAATWLREILKDKYDEVGMIWMANNFGKGHVINFIRNDKYFYFIDMFAMTSNFIYDLPYENGLKKELLKNRNITGIFMRSDNLDDFIEYHSKMMRYKKGSYLYTIIQNDIIPPLTWEKEKRTYYMPESQRKKVIVWNKCESIRLDFLV